MARNNLGEQAKRPIYKTLQMQNPQLGLTGQAPHRQETVNVPSPHDSLLRSAS
ncbi:MAG: hypothetical protein RBU37_13165 [Myxococcota bacterium]|nr:hypothetical protein [Myxococcota bacterium]